MGDSRERPALFYVPQGATMLTRFSGVLDLESLGADQIDLRDLAWSLTRQQRFNGHARRSWTVAQHSVLVQKLAQFLIKDPWGTDHFSRCILGLKVPDKAVDGFFEISPVQSFCRTMKDTDEICLGALIHDCHEAYLGDIVKPVRQLLAIEPIEQRLDAAIYAAFFCAPPHQWDPVHRRVIEDADRIALAWEFHAICGQSHEMATRLSGVRLDLSCARRPRLNAILKKAYCPAPYGYFLGLLRNAQAARRPKGAR